LEKIGYESKKSSRFFHIFGYKLENQYRNMAIFQIQNYKKFTTKLLFFKKLKFILIFFLANSLNLALKKGGLDNGILVTLISPPKGFFLLEEKKEGPAPTKILLMRRRENNIP
jgi:hypothetical protein